MCCNGETIKVIIDLALKNHTLKISKGNYFSLSVFFNFQ